MSHSLRPSGLVLLGLVTAVSIVLLTAAPAAQAATCAGADSAPGTPHYTRAIQCLVNAERAQRALPRLTYDRRLARAAAGFSRSMVRGRFFGHVAPSGSTVNSRTRRAGYRGRNVGETLAWGEGSLATPRAIVATWMASPGHNSIILDRSFRRVGLGAALGSPSGEARGATVTANYGG